MSDSYGRKEGTSLPSWLTLGLTSRLTVDVMCAMSEQKTLWSTTSLCELSCLFPLPREWHTPHKASLYKGDVFPAWLMHAQLINHCRLFGTPWTPPSSSFMGFLRQEYWSGLPFPSPLPISYFGGKIKWDWAVDRATWGQVCDFISSPQHLVHEQGWNSTWFCLTNKWVHSTNPEQTIGPRWSWASYWRLARGDWVTFSNKSASSYLGLP